MIAALYSRQLPLPCQCILLINRAYWYGVSKQTNKQASKRYKSSFPWWRTDHRSCYTMDTTYQLPVPKMLYTSCIPGYVAILPQLSDYSW